MVLDTGLKSDIRAILINHSGRDNAITGIVIAHKLGMKENRGVRRDFRNCAMQHLENVGQGRFW